MTVRTNRVESTGKQCGGWVAGWGCCSSYVTRVMPRHLPQNGSWLLGAQGRIARQAAFNFLAPSHFLADPPLSAPSPWPLTGSDRGGLPEHPCCLLFWGGRPLRPSLPWMLPNRRPPPTPTSKSSSFEDRWRDLESNLPAQIWFFCVIFSRS